MMFTKNFMWSIFLAATLMLMGGCSYSFSHSTETSAGIGEDGKIDASASTSVYTERVENGKTVNNQVTASVGRRDESAADPKASARSGEGISYTVEDADLRKGEVEIVGVFANGGSQSIKIDKVYVSFVFYDEKGKKIWEDETVIENLNLVVKPGTKTPATFVVTNPKAPSFNGSFDMKYQIEYYS